MQGDMQDIYSGKNSLTVKEGQTKKEDPGERLPERQSMMQTVLESSCEVGKVLATDKRLKVTHT